MMFGFKRFGKRSHEMILFLPLESEETFAANFTVASLEKLSYFVGMRLLAEDIPILVAAIASIVTIAGWFITKSLDRRQKRAEFRRTYIQKQIEEFYGPLYSLVWQIFSAYQLKFRILSRCDLVDDQRASVERYFSHEYFLPLHARIKTILETKLYLVEGASMPESIYDYLAHSTQDDAQYVLWAEHGISTISVQGIRFPPAFYDLLKDTLRRLMSEYEVNVQELKTGNSAEAANAHERRRDERERRKRQREERNRMDAIGREAA